VAIFIGKDMKLCMAGKLKQRKAWTKSGVGEGRKE
jgi:hypothetical protein